jgi:hypothetical protein
MILYHCNFGWPLADAGTKLIWEGDMTTRLGEPFISGQTFKTLRDTVPEHSGNGEEVAVVDIEADEQGNIEKDRSSDTKLADFLDCVRYDLWSFHKDFTRWYSQDEN